MAALLIKEIKKYGSYQSITSTTISSTQKRRFSKRITVMNPPPPQKKIRYKRVPKFSICPNASILCSFCNTTLLARVREHKFWFRLLEVLVILVLITLRRVSSRECCRSGAGVTIALIICAVGGLNILVSPSFVIYFSFTTYCVVFN